MALIKLRFPEASQAELQRSELPFGDADPLEWIPNPTSTRYGMGFLKRQESDEILYGYLFAGLVERFGAWVETDSEQTSRKVHNALITHVMGTKSAVKVIQESQ